jgi:deazaflavin-dependent oxidoreductase (nitroreductase family)
VPTYRQTSVFHRLVRRLAGTRLMAKIYSLIQEPIDRLVYRLSKGSTTASSWLGDVKITMLTTTGAKTGRVRTLPVLGLPDGDEMIIIASNFGRRRNPAWYHNLRANPRATVVYDGVTRDMEARELSGDERERDYARGEEIYPGFVYYKRWAQNREIPVLRLTPMR